MLNTKARSSLAWICIRPQRSQDPAIDCLSRASLKSFICHRAAFSTQFSSRSSLRQAARTTSSLKQPTNNFIKALAALTHRQVLQHPLTQALNTAPSVQSPGTVAFHTPTLYLTPTPWSTLTGPRSQVSEHLHPVSSHREQVNLNLRAARTATLTRVATRKLNWDCEYVVLTKLGVVCYLRFKLQTVSISLFYRNGLLQTSKDLMSHSKLNQTQECGKCDPFQQVVSPAPPINGHAHLVNGALKPKDLSPVADEPSMEKHLAECRAQSPEIKPESPSVRLRTKPDPYEFPHSPPKQSNPSPVCPQQSRLQEANEQRLKQTPPTEKNCQVDSDPENITLSPASQSLSPSSMRMNGSHHNASSSYPASVNTNNLTVEPHPPTDKTRSSESSAQLLAQTGGLISEFYSHSRLHQISTWRTGFSEYVNELHSKRKSTESNSFPGKERLRKSLAQRSIDSRGREGRVTLSCKYPANCDCQRIVIYSVMLG